MMAYCESYITIKPPPPILPPPSLTTLIHLAPRPRPRHHPRPPLRHLRLRRPSPRPPNLKYHHHPYRSYSSGFAPIVSPAQSVSSSASSTRPDQSMNVSSKPILEIY